MPSTRTANTHAPLTRTCSPPVMAGVGRHTSRNEEQRAPHLRPHRPCTGVRVVGTRGVSVHVRGQLSRCWWCGRKRRSVLRSEPERSSRFGRKSTICILVSPAERSGTFRVGVVSVACSSHSAAIAQQNNGADAVKLRLALTRRARAAHCCRWAS